MKPAALGAALGSLLGVAALFAAFMSAGEGHGDYVAARALFPAPMLLTELEAGIGVLALGTALAQFPLYGALLGWARVRKAYLPATIAGSLHLVAAMLCFGGALPGFS